MEHKRYQRILATLAVFAMLFCDLNVSSFAEGNTEAEEDRIRTICGLEEHTHTDECYEKTLICGRAESGKKTEKRFKAFQIHEHNDSCYDENGNLNCGIIEGKYYHAHNEYCYDNAGNLVCGLEEVWPHEHTDACYETEKKLICKKEETEGHKHTDACYKQNRELICEKAEDPGHYHSDACYTEHTTLTCGKQEDPGHHHSDACYTEYKELTCEKAEDPGHHHSDACYSEHTDLTCGKQEDPGHHHGEECYRDQKVISCEQEENENHTHTEECYTILHELICEEPERDGHTHGESCYTTTRDLTCKETERDGHAHGDSCYTTLRKLTCGETERDGHTHGESCYTTTRDLTCKERERDGHTHTDSCYRVRNELVCKKEETAGHTHNESCYETQQNLICDELSTTHHHTAACRNEEGRLICGQVEVQEFVSTADRWTEEVISEEHRHTEDCYEQNLICEKAEHTHTDACYPEQEESEEPEDGAADEPPETLDGEQTEATGEASDNDGEGTGGENEEGTETKEDGETDTEDEAGEETGEENEEDTETEEDGETDSEEEAGKEAGEENEEDTEIKENEEDPDEKDGAEDAEEGDGEETDEEELTEEQGETTITAEDAPYAVSISFSGEAGIPEGTKLVVSEAGEETPAGEQSQMRFAKAAPMKSAGLRSAATSQERHVDIPSMTVWSAGEAAPDIILYQKKLDISLISEGEEIEPDPAALITVTVQLPGIEDGQKVEVRHITDGGTELLESTNDAGSITFTTSGFSLFEFISRAQALSAWSTGQTSNTFYGKTANQEAQASAVSVSDVTEGLEVLEAYSLTGSNDLWVVLQRITDIALGKMESIALYTVEDGQLGAIVRENVSLAEVLRFNLGDLGGYALVRDTGLRHIITELGNITLDGMMPKNSAAEATDVREEYSDPMDYEETVAAYDIAILSDGEEYQPGESPIKVSIRNDDITAALEEGKTVRLWHIADGGSREEIPYTLEDGTVSFDAAGFSAYVFSASIEKIITIDGESWKVTVEYGDDAGIPEDAELEIHEVEAGDYQAAAASAWNWTENNYIFYTKFLDISIVRDGETIEPLTPVSVTIQLLDVEAGAEALRVVHFGKDGAEAIEGQAGADGTIQFEADAFSVFGFGNALQPLASTETEEADLTIYGFGGEARLAATEAPEVAEGLEVLGAYALSSRGSSKTENGEEGVPGETAAEETTHEEASEEGTTGEEIPAEGTPETAAEGEPTEEKAEDAAGTGNSNNNRWIKAELKDGTELSETESVVLCSVSGEKTDSTICELTTSGQIMKLEKENLAIIKDTGYRHLNFVLDPNEENQKPAEQKDHKDEEEHTEEIAEAAGNDENVNEESTEDNTGDANEENRSGDKENAEDSTEGSIPGNRVVILDGMMPKDAEAAAIDVTETFAEHEYPAPKEETAEETTEEAQEEPEENKPEAEQTEEGSGEEAAEEKTETRRNTLVAYEITILNNETEYQPDAGRPIQVEIRDSRITADGNIELWHIRDDGTEEQVREFAADKGKITFAATGFSAYAIVELLDPSSLDDEDVENLEELALNWNVPEKGGRGFYLSYNNKSKFISNRVVVSGDNSVLAEVGRAELNDNCIWYFEKQDGTNTTESNKYYIYTYADGAKKYIHQKSANNNNIELSSDTNLKTAFDLSEAASKFFYLKHEGENRWLQHSGSGNGIRLYTDKKNDINSRITFTYAASAAPEGDPLGLNDKTYGLMFWNGNITGKAMMAESSNTNNLDAKAMEVLVKTGDNTDKIFVPNDSDISMWTFEWAEGNTYKISTKKNGAKMYLNVGENGGLSLVSGSDAASLIQVEPGTASHKGQIILKSNNQIIKYSGKVESGFGASRTGGTAGNEWLYLVDYSELTSDYLITYTASKISVSDPQITNDSKIIIYTRYWNDDDKCYDFYAINSDGTIQRCYESGDTIRWVGTRINTLLWDFIEYYYEGSTEPNYYYDLYNQYSQQYLRPQLDGGEALSTEKIGINLDGRKRGAYYSPIIAWDDSAYAFAGLKVDKGTGKVVPCPMDEAEDFYFAVMQKNDVDDDTSLVATVDNKAHGITMKIANYDRVTNEGGQSTSQEQLGVLGFSKFDSGHPTAVQGGILSTDIKGNGYPEATATGRSLADLFSGATEVNHLFIQGTYNGSGYYTYDSTKNYATLRQENGNLGTDFRVYREIGTNDAKSQPSMQHGQFTPFNDIEPGVFSEKNPENLYTATLHELPETDPRKHEKLYLVRNPDLYFGVELEASFVQTPSGKDAWDHDIIYQFTGDDDFWLYVDGELVIDLGGIHSAVGGSVNYHTGEVVVNGRHTTLYQLFYENYLGRGHTEAEAQSYVDGLFTTNGDNKVFKDYTTHTMRIFYMERGGGASNLNMRFNLASVKPGHVELSKKIDGVDNKESLMAEFPYQIFYRKQSMEAAPDETEKLLAEDGNPVNIKVHYKGTNTPVKYAREYTVGGVTYDSVFLLKPGEAADIEIPDKAIYYRIVECGVNTDVYHKTTTPEGGTEQQDITVTVNEGKETVTNNQIYTESHTYLINGEEKTTTVQTYPENRKDYSIGYARTGDRSRAAFVNSVDPTAMRTLTIEKQLFDVSGNPVTYENDKTTFGFRLSLSSENEDEPALVDKYTYHIIDRNGVYCKWDTASQTFVPLGEGKTVYTDLSPEEQKLVRFTTSMNGSISKIPVSYRVEIRGLPVGTKYKVEERKNEIPDGYSLRDYDIYENADDESTLTSYYPSELLKKTIEKNKDPKVVINNLKGFGLRVYKEWNDEDYMEYRDPIYLAVYKDNESGPVLAEGTVRELKQKNNTMYWYFKALGEGYDFDDYVVREVALTNPTLDPEAEGVVVSYDSITPIDEGGTATIDGRQKGESTASAQEYTVHYVQGVPEQDKPNIREDHIFNTRKGLVIRKEDWEGNGLENTTFILKDADYTSGSNLLNASYTSLASGDVGYVTTAFLRKGATYTLTETKTKTGYLGLQAPLTINVDNNGKITVSSTSSADDDFFILSEENETLTVKNKPFTFTVTKIDKGRGTPLSGARFELHKQITVGGVTMFDFNPLPGYTSDIMITGEDGILPGLDETLPAGTYRLDETYAPTRYVKWSTGLIFTVNDVGKITLGSRYPDGTVLTGTPKEIGNQVFYEYKLNIPNSEDSKWPYLQVTKKVTGRTADPTKKFRFTITLPNVDPGAKYDYTLGDETGTVTVDAKHQIIKYLKHGQTLEIARLPLNTSVSVAEETGIYTTDWKKDGTAATATDNAISFNLADSTEIEVTNDMKPVAPTGFTTRHKPYFLLMLFGFMLLTAIAGIGWIQKRRTADGEDDPPDPGDHPKNSNSPPGGRKHFASGGRTNRRSGIRTAEESGYDRKEFPERSYHKMMKLKKISALALAILMITMTGPTFADVSMTDENGVIGEFTEDNPETKDKAVIIYKEITALNPESCTVNAPAITYNYTISASDSLAGKTVTDASSHHNKINNKNMNVSGTTKKGVGAPTITGTGNGVLALVPGTHTLGAAPTGKANRFQLTVDFSSVDFLTDGTGAGVYRYQIDETTTPANRNAAGITDGTVANTLYLDVYVDGSGNIYGYVLFTTNGEINASPDQDTAAASAAGKTEGFVGSKANGEVYDSDNSAADKYYTFNLEVAKTVSGDNYVVTHKNKFPFTVTLANNTVTQNVLPIMTINDTTLAAQDALTAAPIAGTWTPQIASGGMITYVGIPCGTTVTIKEKNNVANTIYNSVSAGADTNAAGKAIATNVESNAAQVTCGQTVLKAATENHTDAKQVKFTNTLLQISPTGIVLRVAPYLLMLAAGIALVVILVAKRRKHTDEE